MKEQQNRTPETREREREEEELWFIFKRRLYHQQTHTKIHARRPHQRSNAERAPKRSPHTQPETIFALRAFSLCVCVVFFPRSGSSSRGTTTKHTARGGRCCTPPNARRPVAINHARFFLVPFSSARASVFVRPHRRYRCRHRPPPPEPLTGLSDRPTHPEPLQHSLHGTAWRAFEFAARPHNTRHHQTFTNATPQKEREREWRRWIVVRCCKAC